MSVGARAALLFVALLPLLPVARLLLVPGVRQRFRGFPFLPVALAGSLVALAAVILAVVFLSPFLLVLAAGFSGGCFVANAIVRRPGYGRKRGLPPGSLSFLAPGPWSDPDFYKKQADRFGPVFKFPHFTVPAVGIVGLERIADFLRSHNEALFVPPAPFNDIVPGGFVRFLAGAAHTEMAGFMRSALAPEVVEHYTTQMAIEAESALVAVAADAPLRESLDRMVCNVMMLLFLGLGATETGALLKLYHVADYRRLHRAGKAQARRAVTEIIANMRRVALDHGRVSFLARLAADQPEAIALDRVLGNLAYALHSSRIDVTDLLVWLTAVAGTNPRWMKDLRAAMASGTPDALQPGGLADRMVRETLRLHQSEFLMRRTSTAIDWNGFRIPAGWQVRLCIAESHRLAEAFARPEQFDPDRFLSAPSRPTCVPFGFTPHRCPGDHLTRAIGRHYLGSLAGTFDISAAAIEPWEFSGFHWRPHAKMNIVLRRVN